MFVKKGFRLFESFYAHLSSKFRKSANKSKKIVIQNSNMGINKRRIAGRNTGMQFFTFTMFDMMVHFLKTFSTDLKKS
jgi:predicted N-acyltransferase